MTGFFGSGCVEKVALCGVFLLNASVVLEDKKSFNWISCDRLIVLCH